MYLPLSRASGLAMLVLLVCTVIGCQRIKEPPQAPPPPQVTTTKPVLHKVQSYYEYNGYLEAVETFQARARVKGFIKKLSFREGEEVKAGDLLYEIDDREYRANVAKSTADIAKAQADIANADAQIRLAESDLERVNRAIASGAAPRTDLDKAVATLAANRAQRDSAIASRDAADAARQTAEIELGYAKIYTPIEGRISRTQVTKGNLVGQNESTLLTTVVSVDPLYVYFDIPEKDLVEYHRSQVQSKTTPSGTSSAIPIEIGVATEKGYPHLGWIDFRENRVDTGTGTVRLRGQVKNPTQMPGGGRLLYPGLYSRIRVPVGEDELRPVIPEDALMTGQEGRYVYVVGPDKKVAKRSVTTGMQIYRAPAADEEHIPVWTLHNTNPSAPDPKSAPIRAMIAIEKGLTSNDTIIVNGLQKARPGTEVTPELWQIIDPGAKAK